MNYKNKKISVSIKFPNGQTKFYDTSHNTIDKAIEDLNKIKTPITDPSYKKGDKVWIIGKYDNVVMHAEILEVYYDLGDWVYYVKVPTPVSDINSAQQFCFTKFTEEYACFNFFKTLEELAHFIRNKRNFEK